MRVAGKKSQAPIVSGVKQLKGSGEAIGLQELFKDLVSKATNRALEGITR
jgi:hypothetical protein